MDYNDGGSVTNSTFEFYSPGSISVESTVLIVISAILCITGFIGNMVIVVIIMKEKTMRTGVNLLVINLAIADLAIVLISIPYNLVDPHISWQFGHFGCKYLIMPTMEHFAGVCVLSHTAISLARYVTISKPSAAEGRFIPVVKASIFIIWTASFLSLSVPLMGIVGNFVLHSNLSERLVCDLHWISDSKRKMYRVWVFILTYVLPMTITGYSYVKIQLKARKSLQNIRRLLSDEHFTTRQRDSRQLNSTLMIMYVMFALITLPLQLFLFLFDFDLIGNFKSFPGQIRKKVFDILVTVFYAQSVSNPMILLYKIKKNKTKEEHKLEISRNCDNDLPYSATEMELVQFTNSNETV